MRIRPGIILLLIWGIFLAAADILYLKYLQPARLGTTVAAFLHDATGLNPVIGQLSFSFIPRAGVEIHALELRPETGHDLIIRAESCRAELSWLSLLRLKPVLSRVELRSPVVDLTWKTPPARGASGEQAESSLAPEAPVPFSWPSELAGMHILLENGTIRIREEQGPRAMLLSGLALDAVWPGLRRGHADIRVERVDMDGAEHVAISLARLRLTAEDIALRRDATLSADLKLSLDAQMDALDEAVGHRIAEPYRYFPLPEPMRLGLGARFSLNPHDLSFTSSGKLELQALFPMNSHLTPLSLSIPFFCSDPGTVDIRDMRIAFDEDRATLNGTLSGLTTAPELKGSLELEQFSLIRWFGFGRAMPAGLQQALNRITGLLEFTLTPHGVVAPRLVARTEGMTLEGEGSCADFSRPDVTITGTLEHAWLDRIFPELGGAGKEKADALPPALPPPVLPLDEDDDDPAPVGYKILLRADAADIIGLTAKQATCLITPAQGASLDAMPQADPAAPAPMDAGHGVLLSITAGDLYGGSGKARVHLASTARIVAEAENVAAQSPIRALAGFSAAGGTAQLKADLSFSGKTARARLESLGGSVAARLANGFLAGRGGTRLDCSLLTLDVRAKGRKKGGADDGRLPSDTDFTGTWAVSLNTPDWNASARTEATLNFSMDNGLPMRMSAQKTNFSVEWPRGLFEPSDKGKKAPALNMSGTGSLSFNLHDGMMKLENANLSFPGTAISGNAALSGMYAAPLLDASLDLSAASLRRTAESLGFSLPATENPAKFGRAKLRTRLKMQNDDLSLGDIRGSLDDAAFSGTAQWRSAPKREFRADLKFDSLDFDAYLPPEGKKTTQSALLPLDFLKAHDLNIMLRATRLNLFSTPLENVNVPLTLSGGALNIGDITASFSGGGSLRGAFHGRLAGSPAALDSRFQLLLTGIDTLALSRARKQDTLLAGTGNGQIKLSARMRRWSDALALANGTWNFSVRDGYFVSAGAENGTPPPSPESALNRVSGSVSGPSAPARTSFDILSASGEVKHGVAESNNFLLRGPMLTVRGTGSLNLVTRAISADATATLLGVPEIPVRIRGTLEKPETSYQIIGAVTSTLGNIGSSTLDLVGSVLTAPFRLFTNKRTLGGR